MTKILRVGRIAVLTAFGILPTPFAMAQDAEQRLGTVHFATSCNELAQRRFDRAMRYQHSFWYRQAKDIFEDALKADPQCAIALWGVALTLLANPHGPPPAANLPLGLAAIEKAKAIGAKTQRERDYIDALAVMYTDYDKTEHRARVQNYQHAMEARAARYGDDDKAQIARRRSRRSTWRRRRATRPMPTSSRAPPSSSRSTGASRNTLASLSHYPHPPLRLTADRRKGWKRLPLCAIAPDAPHAQHMPSHIFTASAIEGIHRRQCASVRAAKADEVLRRPAARPGNYMVYAHLQLGQDNAARRHRRDGADEQSSGRRRRLCAGGSAGGYAVELRRLGGGGALRGNGRTSSPTCRRSRISPRAGAARARKLDAARADSGAAGRPRDQLRAAKTPIGPSRSISNGRPRPPGSAWPKADHEALTRMSARGIPKTALKKRR